MNKQTLLKSQKKRGVRGGDRGHLRSFPFRTLAALVPPGGGRRDGSAERAQRWPTGVTPEGELASLLTFCLMTDLREFLEQRTRA